MELDQHGNEVHGIAGRNLSGSIPWHQRDEWWIRWPGAVGHHVRTAVFPVKERWERDERRHSVLMLFSQVWKWMKGDLFHLLLVALPFAIVAGSRPWSVESIFALGILSFAGLEAMMTSSMERWCVSLGPTAGGICADVITNVTPTSVSENLMFRALPCCATHVTS